MLKRHGVKYDKLILQRLLLWCKSQGIEMTRVNTSPIRTWEAVGWPILDLASRGDDTFKEFLMTWRLVLDTLKELKKEQDTAAALAEGNKHR